MAWTQTDLDTIDAALASGELSVQLSDGRRIVYRSIDELQKARIPIAKAVETARPILQRRLRTRTGW